MGEIRIILSSPDYREVLHVNTIGGAVDYLRGAGYRTLYNPYDEDDCIRMSSRLIQNEPQWNARIDTSSDCRCWYSIVRQVTES